jgi:hypothetical protein
MEMEGRTRSEEMDGCVEWTKSRTAGKWAEMLTFSKLRDLVDVIAWKKMKENNFLVYA